MFIVMSTEAMTISRRIKNVHTDKNAIMHLHRPENRALVLLLLLFQIYNAGAFIKWVDQIRAGVGELYLSNNCSSLSLRH